MRKQLMVSVLKLYLAYKTNLQTFVIYHQIVPVENDRQQETIPSIRL